MRPYDVEQDNDFISAIPEGQSAPELEAAIKETPSLPKDSQKADAAKAIVLFPT